MAYNLLLLAVIAAGQALKGVESGPASRAKGTHFHSNSRSKLLKTWSTATKKEPVTTHPCVSRVENIQEQLKARNISKTCSYLDPGKCAERFGEADKIYSEKSVLHRAKECDTLLLPDKGIWTTLEQDNPMAFNIQVHSDARHLELLLGSVYRPFNTYCLHIDRKSEKLFKETVNAMISCYRARFGTENIFVSKKSIPVYWSHFSVLEAELICMEELLRFEGWKYYVNFAGSELPRFPLSEFIRRAQSIEYPYMRSLKMTNKLYRARLARRFKLKQLRPQKESNSRNVPMIKTKEIRDPPFGLTIYKGYKSMVISREWLNFAIHHPVAQAFKEWSRESSCPEEYFMQTLTRITNATLVDGEWVVQQSHDDRSFALPIFALWSHMDLPWVLDNKKYNQLKMNKFQTKVDRYVGACLAEMLMTP